MPNYRRPPTRGACIFFTVTLADRRSDVLLRHQDHFHMALKKTQEERPFDILDMVLLPDHLHCIWALPLRDGDYATRWRLIKARFSRQLPLAPRRPSHEARRERGLWQRRYWEHHIRDEHDLEAHRTYCWINPVKHGLVACPEDWPYRWPQRESMAAKATDALKM